MTALYVASNTKALGSQVQLQRNISALGEVLGRLSTGLRINSAKDDPSGLIASELLKSDIGATKQAIQNTQRGSSVIAIADSALGQISSLLTDIRSLVNATANEIGLSSGQLTANQLQVDAAIDSIDRISKTTNFQGQKLLDGSMGYQVNGVTTELVSNIDVQSANFGTSGAIHLEVDLIAVAEKAALIHYGTQVDEKTTLNISGKTGSDIFSFGEGTTIRQMAEAINRASDSTGVTAVVEGEPARGTVVLSSTGANNDIVLTSNSEGFDAGNYSFRIVKGASNDAYIVTDPTVNQHGVIEISLEQSYTKTYNNFAGAFDISVQADSATAHTSVSITRGTENSAVYNTEAQNATATTKDATIQVTNAGKDGHMSNLNGWTFQVVDATNDLADTWDMDSKTAYITSQGDSLNLAVVKISGATIDHDQADLAAELTRSGVSISIIGTISIGDTFKFSGGADKGELVITYKEGATLGQIRDLINANSDVQATLVPDAKEDALLANVPSTESRVSGTSALVSNTTSSVTASELVALLNSKLGDMFTATLAGGDSGAGNVTYMNAAADYGVIDTENPELGSAVRFSGLASGPVVRLTEGHANQELSVTLRTPTVADLDAGITTKVLEIQLATDASGRSITTAQELVDFFNTLRADQTGGVSVSLLLPTGVDPNGRTWEVDECGEEIVAEICDPKYGQGIVRGTGETGPCGVIENDLVLLGSNQQLVETNAVAYVANSTPNTITRIASGETVPGVTKDAIGYTSDGTAIYLTAGNGLWNGIKIEINTNGTTQAGSAAWDSENHVLQLTVQDGVTTWDDLLDLINNDGRDVLAAFVSSNFGIGGSFVPLEYADSLGQGITFTDEIINLSDTSFILGSGSPGAGATSAHASLGGTTDYPWAYFTDNTGSLSYIETLGTSILNGVTVRFQIDTQGILQNNIADARSAKAVSFDESTGVMTVLMYSQNGTVSSGGNARSAINAWLGLDASRDSLKNFNGSNDQTKDDSISGSAISGIKGNADTLDGVEFTLHSGVGYGDVLDAQASTGRYSLGSNDFIWLSTKTATSSLNGVSVNFTSDPAKSGFNAETGALTVYLGQELYSVPASGTGYADNISSFNDILNQTINGAIHSHWEQIRQYTGSTEGPVQVESLVINMNNYEENDLLLNPSSITAELLLEKLSESSTQLKFSTNSPDDAGNYYNSASRGTSVNDAALRIEANVSGTEMVGIQIAFQQDDSMRQSTNQEAFIRTDFTTASDGTRVLTVYANALQNGTTGGINAAVLADALNRDENFASLFSATSPVVNNDPMKTTTTATVAFGAGAVLSTTQTVGGVGIETDDNGLTKSTTSAGVAMFGNQDDNQRLVLKATEYGSDAYVRVQVVEGSFSTYGNDGLATSYIRGQDAVVNVNGQLASATGQKISVSNSSMQLSFNIRDELQAGDSTSFYISNGGIIVQAGADVVSSQQVRIGISEVSSATLGGDTGKLFQLKTGGLAELKTNTKLADKIVQEAIQSISTLRGRLGTLQRSTLEPNQAVLEDTVEQLSSAEALISNADFAEESSALTRTQILVQSGNQVLSLANQLPQYAIQLIG